MLSGSLEDASGYELLLDNVKSVSDVCKAMKNGCGVFTLLIFQRGGRLGVYYNSAKVTC